jgi:anti-sigma regulatory factor (Ser/Thr protein kinase)
MNTFVLRCKADPKSARRLVKAAMALAGDFVADADALHELELAMCEASANVARHAYAGVPTGIIEIRLAVKPGKAIDAEVVDWGKGFDKEVCYDNAAACSECGRGMFLISSLTDKCEVRRNDGENVVSIHKQIGKSSWKN